MQAKLGMVKSKGGSQVTFGGKPLYTFVQDKKPGDMKGNGFKDVGTWQVVTVSGKAVPTIPPLSSGGGYGY